MKVYFMTDPYTECLTNLPLGITRCAQLYEKMIPLRRCGWRDTYDSFHQP